MPEDQEQEGAFDGTLDAMDGDASESPAGVEPEAEEPELGQPSQNDQTEDPPSDQVQGETTPTPSPVPVSMFVPEAGSAFGAALKGGASPFGAPAVNPFAQPAQTGPKSNLAMGWGAPVKKDSSPAPATSPFAPGATTPPPQNLFSQPPPKK